MRKYDCLDVYPWKWYSSLVAWAGMSQLGAGWAWLGTHRGVALLVPLMLNMIACRRTNIKNISRLHPTQTPYLSENTAKYEGSNDKEECCEEKKANRFLASQVRILGRQKCN